MANLNPYLNFKGTTEEAFNFYRSVFGGEFQSLMRFGDANVETCAGGMPVEKDKIMHIALPVKDGLLMGTDVSDSADFPFVEGNNISLSLNVDSREEADKLYLALSEGGTRIVPLAQMFWGDYFGIVGDRFGIQWMINCARHC